MLAGSIETSWLADNGWIERLADCLWAGAQCCSNDAARLLAPICDSWAELPDEVEGNHSVLTRDSLAAYEIRWAFQLWSFTIAKGDIPVLKCILTGNDFENEALFQRLRREDNEAITKQWRNMVIY